MADGGLGAEQGFTGEPSHVSAHLLALDCTVGRSNASVPAKGDSVKGKREG